MEGTKVAASHRLEPQAAGFAVAELPVSTWNDADVSGRTDTLAPLIFECWYVIALSRDVDRSLRKIQVLGEPLVYYRTESGAPVVLDDRCAHRRFPLSKGRLTGDAIQCGYHGFTYAPSGQCVWAPGARLDPGQPAKLPFGVRAYPCAERGPWLWVWMGRPEHADADRIPLPVLETGPDATIHGYKENRANYMMLIENLLDLSHVHFLHDAADLVYVETGLAEAPAPADGVAWKKVIDRTEAGVITTFCGEEANRLVYMEDEVAQYGPSLTVGTQRRKALPGDNGPPVRPARLHVVHALTPIDQGSTHQFFLLTTSEPFAVDPEVVLHVSENVVFQQDVDAVRDMQAYVEKDARPGRVEFSMAYDRFGLKMRRILQAMKERESRPA